MVELLEGNFKSLCLKSIDFFFISSKIEYKIQNDKIIDLFEYDSKFNLKHY